MKRQTGKANVHADLVSKAEVDLYGMLTSCDPS